MLISLLWAQPLHVWKVEKRQVTYLTFTSTSSLLPEGRLIYLNNKCELVYLEKKFDTNKKSDKGKVDKEKVSLSMSKAQNPRKEESLSAFESAFGKLPVDGDDKAQESEKGKPVRTEEVGILVPREHSDVLYNPTAPGLSHIFNGPSHLLPSPAKIYSSFMDGLLKKAHTQVATATHPSAQQGGDAAEAHMEVDYSKKATSTQAPIETDSTTSKNVHCNLLTLACRMKGLIIRSSHSSATEEAQ